jgi:hypothetical protein
MTFLADTAPDSWWEFAVLHALHYYNRTPLRRLKWQTPYTILNDQVPDISHLKVFGCGAYVHIPKDRHVNALAPKSELMVYIGHTEGIKAFTFMHLTNNTVFTSTTALFDETIYPKCDSMHIRGTTRVREPRAQQPPMDAEEDTTPGNLDSPIPPETQSEGLPAPDGEHVPSDDEEPAVPVPSPEPEPAPRRSARLRKIPTRSGNVYGECRHPTKIEKDVQQSRTWRKMTEHMPGSFRNDDSSEQPTSSTTAPPRAPSSVSSARAGTFEKINIIN